MLVCMTQCSLRTSLKALLLKAVCLFKNKGNEMLQKNQNNAIQIKRVKSKRMLEVKAIQ